MKKILLLLIAFVMTSSASAQKAIDPTNEFIIEGLIENNVVVNMDSLKNYPTMHIDSLIITNHLGQKKSTLKKISVIPIKNFLDKVEIKVENPKQLSEVYFIFVASDDYKVVFSWNEIFNNKIGQEIYIITEKDGKKIEDLDDRISIISRTDFNTGRRYVKSLKKIIVKRIE